MKKISRFALIAVLGWLAACSAQFSEQEAGISPTQVIQERSSAQTLASPTVPPTTSQESTDIPVITLDVRKISESPSYDFGWKFGRNVLLYTHMGSTEVWSYDVATGNNQPSLEDVPWRLDKEVLDTLPPEVQNVGGSPSGTRILYTVPDVPATPTPHPDGPASLNRYPVQLWLWEEGKVRKLGTLEDCIDSYLWSGNEQVVVVSTYFYRGQCGVQTWIVELEADRLYPMFLKSDYEGSVHVNDITSDGGAILFGTGTRTSEEGRLFVRQLDGDRDALVLSHPNSLLVGRWLQDEQRLLVKVLDQSGPQWFIYDNNGTELKQTEIPVPDEVLGNWRMSSDRNWLALLTQNNNEFEPNGLWLVDLSTLK